MSLRLRNQSPFMYDFLDSSSGLLYCEGCDALTQACFGPSIMMVVFCADITIAFKAAFSRLKVFDYFSNTNAIESSFM